MSRFPAVPGKSASKGTAADSHHSKAEEPRSTPSFSALFRNSVLQIKIPTTPPSPGIAQSRESPPPFRAPASCPPLPTESSKGPKYSNPGKTPSVPASPANPFIDQDSELGVPLNSSGSSTPLIEIPTNTMGDRWPARDSSPPYRSRDRQETTHPTDRTAGRDRRRDNQTHTSSQRTSSTQGRPNRPGHPGPSAHRRPLAHDSAPIKRQRSEGSSAPAISNKGRSHHHAKDNHPSARVSVAESSPTPPSPGYDVAKSYAELQEAWKQHNYLSRKLQSTNETIRQLTKRLLEHHPSMSVPEPPSASITPRPPTNIPELPSSPVAPSPGILEATPAASANHQPNRFHRRPIATSSSPVQEDMPVSSPHHPTTETRQQLNFINNNAAFGGPGHLEITMTRTMQTIPNLPVQESTSSAVKVPVAAGGTLSLARFIPRGPIQTIKAFPRKPRALLTHEIPWTRGNGTGLITTNTLDGGIQFWNPKSHGILDNIPASKLRMPFAEDMIWVGPETLALIRGDRGSDTGASVTFIHITNIDQRGVGYHIQSLLETECASLGYPAIAAIGDTDKLRFVTATASKKVILWDYSRPQPVGRGSSTPACSFDGQFTWTTGHTGKINAMAYLPYGESWLSGGADGRVFMQPLERTEAQLILKADRVSHVLPHPRHPSMLLITRATMDDQLILLDLRQPNGESTGLTFGFPQSNNLSQYVTPSFHPEGTLVVCGRHDDGFVNVWDIRYAGLTQGPSQSIGMLDKKVLKSAFMWDSPTMVSVGTSNSMAFFDFQLEKGLAIQ